jgi:glycosyltransferase involved in cell wall biosynthesis
MEMLTATSKQGTGRGVGGTLKAYWFSQTVGLNRGLQAFLKAMAATKVRVSLDIQGSNRWGHGDTLMSLAGELGIADRVRLLPLAPPDEMVNLATAYDIGLSLETGSTENHRLCLGNKIFTYLLAGVPVILSDTPAQSMLAAELGEAAALVSLSDPTAMARTLDQIGSSPDVLGRAKAAASRSGRERYNWQVEKQALLSSVDCAFARQGRA